MVNLFMSRSTETDKPHNHLFFIYLTNSKPETRNSYSFI